MGFAGLPVASMAALATIMTIIGVRERLVVVSMLGWSSAAYCLVIKPARLLVMFAVAGIWLMRWWFGRCKPD